jgi:hypothetical protein
MVDGNRVRETAGGVTTAYLVDTLNPTGYSQVLDELVSSSVKKTYTYGLQRISENQLSGTTWTPTFYGYDRHGNVRFLTSSTGTVGNTRCSGEPWVNVRHWPGRDARSERGYRLVSQGG